MDLAKTLLLPALLAFPLTTAAQDESLPAILDFYPNCDYEVLGEGKVQKKILLGQDTFGSDKRQYYTPRLLKRLQRQAQDIGANAVILTEAKRPLKKVMVKTNTSRENTLQLSFAAEFILDCAPGIPGDKATPVNQHGEPQRGVATASSEPIIAARTLKITLPPSNAPLQRPELASNQINLEQGAYGATLGMTLVRVVEKLGTPSLVLNSLDQQQLLSYGRRFWLRFVDGRLVEISSHNRWVSMELFNLIEPDSRFNQPWLINNQYQEGAELASSPGAEWQQAAEGKTYYFTRVGEHQLELIYKELHNSYDTAPTQSVADFRIGLTGQNQDSFDLPVLGQTLAEKVSLYQQERIGSTESDWSLAKYGVIKIDSSTEYHIVGRHSLLKVSSGNLKRLMLNESLLKAQNSSAWNLAQWHQGQAFSDAEANAGENYFALGDVIEVTEERTMTSLNFYESGDELKLYSATVDLY